MHATQRAWEALAYREGECRVEPITGDGRRDGQHGIILLCATIAMILHLASTLTRELDNRGRTR